MIFFRFMTNFLLVVFLFPISSLAGTEAAIVKIFTTAKKYNYDSPWQVAGFEEWSGSGCVIAGRRILTNAHVVSNATYIEVQRNGDPEKYVAEVLAVAHEADLALLQVGNERFFAGVKPLELDGLPELLDSVVVYGFPEGGDGLSVTKGIVSRIELIDYVHSWQQFLGLQIDAAINSGNSGGPVVKDGKVVGVVMQSQPKSENIGYIIPTGVINHFLKDLEDGQYDGFPDDGIITQSLENPMLRAATGLPQGEAGVYVSHVIPGTGASGLLFPSDVVLEIDGHPVANDGSVLFRSGLRVASDMITTGHQLGDAMQFVVWREGKKQPITVPLATKRINSTLVKTHEYDTEPEYYILAGLVFMPLSFNYLATWGKNWTSDAPPNLIRFILQHREKIDEQVVIVSRVLGSRVNTGYVSAVNTRIVSVNGREFASFSEFATLMDKTLQGDDLIVLMAEDRSVIAISPKDHGESERQILQTYGIDMAKQVRD